MSQDPREVPSGPSGHSADIPPFTPKRWRLQFPYHWDSDELVSRRELLQFTIYASGSVFAVTTLFALLGWLKRAPMSPVTPIVRIGDVPEGGAFYFRYPTEEDQAVLLHLPGERFVAYSQRCTHLSCAVYFHAERKQLVCPCHEGVFTPLTGDPVAGPPRRRLEQIHLRQEGDMLYAVAITP